MKTQLKTKGHSEISGLELKDRKKVTPLAMFLPYAVRCTLGTDLTLPCVIARPTGVVSTTRTIRVPDDESGIETISAALDKLRDRPDLRRDANERLRDKVRSRLSNSVIRDAAARTAAVTDDPIGVIESAINSRPLEVRFSKWLDRATEHIDKCMERVARSASVERQEEEYDGWVERLGKAYDGCSDEVINRQYEMLNKRKDATRRLFCEKYPEEGYLFDWYVGNVFVPYEDR